MYIFILNTCCILQNIATNKQQQRQKPSSKQLLLGSLEFTALLHVYISKASGKLEEKKLIVVTSTT
jgi:hypothetical protein